MLGINQTYTCSKVNKKGQGCKVKEIFAVYFKNFLRNSNIAIKFGIFGFFCHKNLDLMLISKVK